ncbi:MAG: hypothetical protein HY021_03800 [Burkholderiales bacterium]|nr:hypothetical protein [Burkholderiales bacterium]
MLIVYLGQDGASKAFVTLEARSGSQRGVSHRTIPEGDTYADTLSAIASAMPAMLAELALPRTLPERPALGPKGCDAAVWQLREPVADQSDAARACAAIVRGSLLPEYEQGWLHMGRSSALRLAWLAQAYVEATALSPKSPEMSAIRDLALFQLRLGGRGPSLQSHIRSKDPVVAPLARMLNAKETVASMPVKSGQEAMQREIEQAASALPALASSVLVERGLYEQAFRQVALCSIERHVLQFKRNEDCPPAEAAAVSPTPAQGALLEEWRLAASYKSVLVSGLTQGSPGRLADAIAAIPPSIAEHPFMRWRVNHALAKVDADRRTSGYLDRAKDLNRALLRVAADLQDTLWMVDAGEARTVVSADTLGADAEIGKIMDAMARLAYVSRYDTYNPGGRSARYMAGDGAPFLAAGAFEPARKLAQARSAERAHAQTVAAARAAMAQRPAPDAVASPPPARPFVYFPLDSPAYDQPQQTAEEWQQEIREFPGQMEPRLALMELRVRQGAPLEQALKLVDERPRKQRREEQVAESHQWAYPAHALFFAAEPAAARRYYRIVREIGTGSGSDLHARARLAQIDGDWKEFLDATRARGGRYGGPYAVRDEAAIHFMQGRQKQAWAMLMPALSDPEPQAARQAAFAGHRMAGKTLREVQTWQRKAGLVDSIKGKYDTSVSFLDRYAYIDRRPTADDLDVLEAALPADTARSARYAGAKLQLVQALLGPTPDELTFKAFVSNGLGSAPLDQLLEIRPIYAIVDWRVTQGKDAALDRLRRATESADSWTLLSKAAVLALDGGQPAEAARWLRAARFRLSAIGFGMELGVDMAPYTHALVAFVVARQTGDPAWREESLRFARGYQVVYPYLGWPHALEAALTTDAKERQAAACRARYLDPGSLLLSYAAPGPAVRGPECRNALDSLTGTRGGLRKD